VLTSMGKAHCTYRKEQKLEQEVEDHRKEMERKSNERLLKIYKEERGELLDEIYGDCYLGNNNSARQRLTNVEVKIAELEGTAVTCPVCQRSFADEEYRDEHIFKSKNKGHRQYWEEMWGRWLTDIPSASSQSSTGNHLNSNTHKRMAETTDEEGILPKKRKTPAYKEDESPSPKILPGQTDIRSFFGKPKA